MINESKDPLSQLDKLSASISEQSVAASELNRVKTNIEESIQPESSKPLAGLRSAPGWIAIASLSACIVLMFSLFGPGRADAFAQMQQRLAELKTIEVSRSSFTKDEPEPYHSTKYLIQEPLLFRMEEEGIRKRISVIDVANFQAMAIWPEAKQCHFSPIYDTDGFLRMRNELLDLLRFSHAKTATRIGVKTINQRKTIEYEVEAFQSIDEETSIANVFIDPKTKLPVKLILSSENGDYTVMENFVFDEFIEPSLFEMEAPEGYKVNRVAAVDDSDLKLDPALGLGNAVFGMKKKEVFDAIGSCDLIAPFGYWSKQGAEEGESRIEVFYARGFRVSICPKNGAFQFTCGNFGDARPFQGLTDKGIRLGASRESVKEAHGSEFEAEGDSMTYLIDSETTLLFRFDEDEVDEIVLTRHFDE